MKTRTTNTPVPSTSDTPHPFIAPILEQMEDRKEVPASQKLEALAQKVFHTKGLENQRLGLEIGEIALQVAYTEMGLSKAEGDLTKYRRFVDLFRGCLNDDRLGRLNVKGEDIADFYDELKNTILRNS